MSIRIVSQEQIRFDVDVESYNRIVRDVSNTVADRLPTLVRQEMSTHVIDNVVNSIDISTIAYQVAMQMDYHRIIEYAKTELARFITLLQRGINTATVGVINETVEIVTSRIENQTTNEGDI